MPFFAGEQQFGVRLLVLLALMGAVAAVELWRRGAAATRWREYAFVLGVAVVGAVVGAAIDACTSRLSPAYFIDWKGIEPGEGFERRALQLGAKAGFGAGFFAAALLAFANTRRDGAPLLRSRALAGRAARVLLVALSSALLLAVAAPLLELPAPVARRPFRLDRAASHAWWIHLGAYAGAAIGLAAELWRLRRARRAASRAA